jgi:hypothetical protein
VFQCSVLLRELRHVRFVFSQLALQQTVLLHLLAHYVVQSLDLHAELSHSFLELSERRLEFPHYFPLKLFILLDKHWILLLILDQLLINAGHLHRRLLDILLQDLILARHSLVLLHELAESALQFLYSAAAHGLHFSQPLVELVEIPCSLL